VAILGAGTIGLLSIAVARQAGAAEVLVTARYPAQAALAHDLGATHVFESGEALAEAQGSNMADVVIETVGGRAETLRESVRVARPGGTIAMLGVFAGSAKIPALDFSTKELTMVGSNCYGMADGRSDFAIAVDLLGRIGGQIAPVVTHRFPLDEVNRAFETAADKSTGSIKVHILP
jgi:threonine dehydrogenase-like Zn-dependent dehydrogenase